VCEQQAGDECGSYYQEQKHAEVEGAKPGFVFIIERGQGGVDPTSPSGVEFEGSAFHA
jgi:hypothetical protein